jgi:glycosyltransferase involved in cell wall biosynthesis
VGRRRFREKFAIPERAKVVLFLGRFDQKKGLDLLLPALSDIRHAHPEIWLALAGSGDDKEMQEVRRVVDASNISQRTTFCGFLSGEDRSQAFAGSDIFALPSYNENFGIAAVEAAYAGLGLVVSRNVFVHSELEHLPGVVVCDATRADCARALEKSLGSLQFSRADREHELVTVFGRGAATQRLLDLYRGVLAPETVESA